MKTLSVILLLIIVAMQPKEASYLVIQGKSITVDGNTSIGGFSCNFNLAGQNDTLFIDHLNKNPYIFSLPVPEFQCGNFLLNRDFQSTLQSKEYPSISVQVLSLIENNKGELIGKINLILVGKSKILNDVKFNLGKADHREVLSAEFLFKASEFELKPPKRLGGMIKADDTMNITVELILI